ncbi:oxidoreductase C-terminal domain-containing protein [Nonomuraea sp. NPDC049784]|uniref:oxidoreductase C-terminal domain-containing protein n=1 Tax=Nonomuraea sp. NPDC049784 TaxID=3154361 RepID=UPI0033E1ED8E
MTTYVLVHGGAHGGWCYQRVARILRSAGHTVYTPTMTGVGERAQLRPPAALSALNAEFVLGDPATGLDVPSRAVHPASGRDRPYTPIPYFWTDQFDAKIHVHGTPSPDAEVSIVEGAVAERRFVAVYRRDGQVTGVLGWNMPKQARQHRQELAATSLVAGSA